MITSSEFKDEVRRHFDERADRYDHDTETIDRQDFANFETVIPYVVGASGRSVLEVGTGSGIVLELLLKEGKEATGLDLSPGLLRIAEQKRKIPAERLVCGDAEALPFPDARFDAVCVFRSLHHIPDQEKAIREMVRCSRKAVFIYDSAGGWRRLAKRALRGIGLYQPLYYARHGKFDNGYRPALETEGPVKVFCAEDAIPILRASGLRIVRAMRLGSSMLIHAEK